MNAAIGLPVLSRQLTAELALLALRAADLPAYLQAHGKVLQNVLRPRGLGYATRSQDGNQLAYHLSHNLTDLSTSSTESTAARPLAPIFGQALLQVLKTGQALQLTPAESNTPYIHHWEPCIFNGQVVYILHFWFPEEHPINPTGQKLLLSTGAKEIALYIKLQGLSELSGAISQTVSHTHLLEELSGEQDLESIGWNLVNYARESLKCSRVCLFVAKDYTKPETWAKNTPIDERSFVIQACSGLKKVNKRGEQAVTLSKMAKKLLSLALHNTKSSTPEGTEGPRTVIGLAQRDTHRRKDRPAAVQHYFDHVPMNWAIVLPLYGRDHLIAGLLLFEGQAIPQNLALNVLRMRAVAHAGGYAIATALKWERLWTLKLASKWGRFLEKVTPKWQRMMAKKWAIGLAALVAIFLCPFPYRIKGAATLRPLIEENIPAYRTAVLTSRPAIPGQSVKKDDLLATLDTEELSHALARAESELYQAEAAIGRARLTNNPSEEAGAHIAVRTALGSIDALNLAIEQSFIRAPFDGLLTGPGTSLLRKGAVVSMGQTLATVCDPTNWHVQVNLREQDLIKLEERLKSHGPTSGKLSLLADPSHPYELILEKPSQLIYGTDPLREDYKYLATFTLHIPPSEGNLLRRDYVGDAFISVGWQTLAHLFFHDFIVFCKVRWF